MLRSLRSLLAAGGAAWPSQTSKTPLCIAGVAVATQWWPAQRSPGAQRSATTDAAAAQQQPEEPPLQQEAQPPLQQQAQQTHPQPPDTQASIPEATLPLMQVLAVVRARPGLNRAEVYELVRSRFGDAAWRSRRLMKGHLQRLQKQRLVKARPAPAASASPKAAKAHYVYLPTNLASKVDVTTPGSPLALAARAKADAWARRHLGER